MPDPITPAAHDARTRPDVAAAAPRTRPAGATAAAALLALGLHGVAALGVASVSAAPAPAFASDEDEPPAPHEPSPEPVGPVPVPEAPPTPEAESPEEVEEPPAVAPGTSDPAANGQNGRRNGSRPNDPRGGLAGGNSLGKYFGTWADGLYASGGASLSSRNFSVAGSPEARQAYVEQFNFQGFGVQQIGPFQQNMDLTLQGKVFNMFNINARLTNNRQGNFFNQVFGFNYDARGTQLDIGDVAASLPGNQFVSFSRTLRGLQFGRDFGNGMSVRSIASLTQSVARTGSVRGNGSTGPYSMSAASIIPGTVTVRVNGQPKTEGTDYRIDYQLGQIWFLGSNLVNEADTIDFSYESQSFNTTPGLLTGVRFDQTLGNGSAYGFTWLKQTPTSGRSGTDVLEQRYQISGNMEDRYFLPSPPEPNTEIEVAWAPPAGTPQILKEGIDFIYRRAASSIQLVTALPPDITTGNLSLRVRYRPQLQTGVATEKSIIGFDGQTRLGGGTTLAFQFGSSQGQGANQSGTAMSMTASFKPTENLSGDLTWSDIGAGFSTLDTVQGAFLQIQKGLRGSLNYSPSKYVSLRTSMNQSRIATQNSSLISGGTGDDGQNSAANPSPSLSWNNNTSWNAAMSIAMPNLPRLDLTHAQTQQTSQGTSSNRSTFVSDQLSLNYAFGSLASISGSLGRTVSRGRSVFLNNLGSGISNGNGGGTILDDLLNGNLTTANSASNTARLQLSVTPASWVSFVGSTGVSRNTSGGAAGGSSSARDSSLGVSLPLSSRLSLGLNFVESSNGRTTYSQDDGQPSSANFDGQRTRTTGFNARYMPLDTLDLNVDVSRALSLIPGYDNTDTVTSNFTVAYQPTPMISLTGLFGNQTVKYIGTQRGNSDNRSWSLMAQAGPIGNLTFTASLQRMNVGSALFSSAGVGSGGGNLGNIIGGGGTGVSLFSQQQDLTIFSLRADYPIGGNRSLFLQWQSTDSRSPLVTDETDSGTAGSFYSATNYRRGTGTVGLEVRLNELMGLSFDYNLIDMLDRGQSRYSYRANAFNMDLSARF